MSYLRLLPEWWRGLDSTVRDLPWALFLLGASLVPAFHNRGTLLGGVPDRPFDELAVVAVALQCLPVVGRRRWPIACLTVASIGLAIDQLLGYHSFGGTAWAFVLFSAGAYAERYRHATVVVFSAAYVLLAAELHRLGDESPVVFLTYYLAMALVWGVGAWLRSNRTAEAERHIRVAEETRTAERTRIARELHDVVTHHVTAMVVQAEAARYLTAAPDRLDQALTAISATGRRATTDLRHLLDLLSPDHGTEPRTPPVGRLLALVEQTRRAGQPVDFTEQGTPAESTGSADLVAYRVVQEALTNALKYATASPTAVRVHHGEREIIVEVDTQGPGEQPGVPPSGGRGLAGLRERVDVLGGEFSAGPQDAGGFAVRARIPTGAPS